MKLQPSKKLIYLDNAATTPLEPLVLKSMIPYLATQFGNPSSLHKQGINARSALEESREIIAKVLNCGNREVVFTAGGTEAINLAWLGICPPPYQGGVRGGSTPHAITTTIEHHAVLACAEEFERQGGKATYLDTDSEGFVTVEQVLKAVKSNTRLISIMYANNEIGTIQDIAKIGRAVAQLNVERLKKKLPAIIFHTDAAQAAGSLDLNIHKLNVDLLTATASKFYGPKQVGFLYKRTGINLHPIVFGGGQEAGLRSGTENVAGAVGMATALELAYKDLDKNNKKITELRNYFIQKVLNEFKSAKLNGPTGDSRLPNNINFTFPGIEGETLVLYLDSFNIAASTGSACSTVETNPSHVLRAIGLSEDNAKSSVRFSLSKSTTKTEIDYTLKALKHIFTII